MKHFYINSIIASLHVTAGRDAPRQWLFTCGDRWLLLTPRRLQRLSIMLGLRDRRVDPLVRAVRRESPWSAEFSRCLGLDVPAMVQTTICPQCDSVHEVHEDDVLLPCQECRRRNEERVNRGPTQKMLQERARDKEVRALLAETDPFLFYNGDLSPNWQYNAARRLDRDWDAATTRILQGARYRQVAREINCSVGLLHREVKKRCFWEDN